LIIIRASVWVVPVTEALFSLYMEKDLLDALISMSTLVDVFVATMPAHFLHNLVNPNAPLTLRWVGTQGAPQFNLAWEKRMGASDVEEFLKGSGLTRFSEMNAENMNVLVAAEMKASLWRDAQATGLAISIDEFKSQYTNADFSYLVSDRAERDWKPY